jgi:hypothetical protein
MLDSENIATMPPSSVDTEDAFPSASDEIFKVKPTKRHLATDQDWYFYAQGYMRATEVMLEEVERNEGQCRKLGAPMIFVSRQYLELIIKGVIRNCQQFLGHSIDIPVEHRFEVLWPMCSVLIDAVFAGYADSDEMRNTSRLLMQFSAVDPNSTVFRYPADRQGNVSLANVDAVDLREVASAVSKISIMLECVQAGIDAMND